MPVVDMDKVADLIKTCAEEIILPRYQQLKDHEIDTKTGPRDLVTQADILAEAFLEQELPNLYTGSTVVGEEGISRGDHDLKTLQCSADQPVWVIDPVDGTYNFVHGNDHFGPCQNGSELGRETEVRRLPDLWRAGSRRQRR